MKGRACLGITEKVVIVANLETGRKHLEEKGKDSVWIDKKEVS